MASEKQKAIVADLIQAARLINAPYSEANLTRIVSVFGQEILSGYVLLRATTQYPRELNFRYLKRIEDTYTSLYNTCVAEGFIKPQHKDIDKIFSEVEAVFPSVVPFHNADFDADFGVSKLWYSFTTKTAIHPSSLSLLTSAPKSLLALVEAFLKVELHEIVIVGVNYQKAAFNIYFRLPKLYHATTKFVEDFLSAINFEIPAKVICDFCASASVLAVTTNWDDCKRRIAFYKLATLEEVKSILGAHPLCTEFVENAPSFRENPGFVFSQSLGPKVSDAYCKIEKEYIGDISEIFAMFTELYDRR